MVRIWRSIGLVALLVTQACWLQVGAGPQRRGSTGESQVTTATVAELEVAWTATVGASPREALVLGDVAYVRSSGSVTALDVDDGAPRWTTGSLGGRAAPAIVGNRLRVPVSGNRCALAALGLSAGARMVDLPFGPSDTSGLGGFSACTPGDAVAVGGTVVVPWTYLGAAQSRGCIPELVYQVGPGIVALDVDAGTPRWADQSTQVGCGAPTSVPPPYGAASSTGPDSAVVAVDQGVRTFGCTATGCPPAWSVTTGEAVVGPPVILSSGDTAVATASGRLLVVDGTTHLVEWTTHVDTAIGQPLAADGTSIFAVSGSGVVAAFPAAGCGAATCAPTWTATLGGPAGARPSVGGDVLYVGGVDGSVSALAASGCGAPTCPALWTGTTPAAVSGAPVIADGRVVVGSADGTITAFALPV